MTPPEVTIDVPGAAKLKYSNNTVLIHKGYVLKTYQIRKDVLSPRIEQRLRESGAMTASTQDRAWEIVLIGCFVETPPSGERGDQKLNVLEECCHSKRRMND